MFYTDTLFHFMSWEFEGTVALALYFAVAAAIILAGAFVRTLLRKKVFPALIAYTEKKNYKPATILLTSFTNPTANGAYAASILIAISTLPWSISLVYYFTTLALRIAVIMVITIGFWNAVDLADMLLAGASSHFDFAENKTITMVIRKTYRVLVGAFCLIILMGEFNFEVTGVITSLGLVGLTISLAAQDSASNLFAGFLILIERPFNIGDWVSINGTEGIVEDITFRSTKIRALDNSLFVLPNANVSGTTINNGTNRTKRMYRFTLGVTYSTTRPQLEKLMVDLEAMLKAHPHTVPDSALVRLAGFGDSSIDLLVNCYLDTVELPDFLSVQNELHLNIMDVMAANNASFAFPSTSVYIEKTEA